MQNKICLFFITLFLLSSCGASNYSKFNYNKEEFAKKEKGIVFFYMTEENIPLHFNIRNLSSGEDTRVLDHTLETYNIFTKPKPFDLTKKYFILDPGIYYINYINLLRYGDLVRWYPSPGVRNKMVLYGAFEVKAGDVVSLGRLDIVSGKFSHTKNIDLLQSQLADSKMPELKDLVKEGHFYNRGSLLFKPKNTSKEKLIDVTVIDYHRSQILKEIQNRVQKSEK